jgi:sulfur-oxidizing protein SoxY
MDMDWQAASRRQVLLAGAVGAAAVVVGPGLALATPDQAAAEMKKLYGDKPIADGKIKLDIPSIAENGLVVPLSFEVESPMSEKDYVKSVVIFSEENPTPLVASYHYTPAIPKAAAQLRIRLAKTQNIIAVAEMSDGKLYTAKKECKVTVGGCGG